MEEKESAVYMQREEKEGVQPYVSGEDESESEQSQTECDLLDIINLLKEDVQTLRDSTARNIAYFH